MFGDPREQAEKTILAKLQALTTADGLPEPFKLVTREMTHLADVKESQLPVAFLQCEEAELTPMLSHVYEAVIPTRVVIAFAQNAVLPATVANQYRLTIERMLMNDHRLGGLIDQITLKGHLMPGLWPETGLLAIGVLFSLTFEYDARAVAITG